MMFPRILLPTHPHFDEFIFRLSGSEGCNFRWVPDSTSKTGRRMEWECGGHGDTSHTEAILRRLNETVLRDYPVDMEATLYYFAKHGGFCDCEIVLNIPPEEPEAPVRPGFFARLKDAVIYVFTFRHP